jgi:hypothetical protein
MARNLGVYVEDNLRLQHTKEACEAEGGTFYPYMFTWMIHVFPYENDFKEVFSMNDDVAHVH